MTLSKKIFVFMLALMFIASAALVFAGGDQESKDGGKAAAKAGEDMTFAFIIPSLDANWYKEIVDSFKYGAEEVGAEVIVLSSDYDVNKEVANIDLCVTQQVDGLCMFSFNETGAVLAAKKMAEAGIPIIVADSVGQALKGDADMFACIDFDWYEMGVKYADWMNENTKGDFVIITGNFEHYPCIFVNQGMNERSVELGRKAAVDSRDTDYNPDKAAKVAEDLIASGLEFETIFVMMEEMAASVVRVLKAQGVLNKPYRVISQNGQDHGIDMVKTGDMAMTISSSPGWEGYLSFRFLYSQIMGKINYKNKQIMVPTTVVTQKEAINRDPKTVVPWHRNKIFLELTEEYFPELMWY